MNSSKSLIQALALCACAQFMPAQSPASPAPQSNAPTPLLPMPPGADPAFEVATIKPTDTSAPHGKYIHIDGATSSPLT